MYEFIFLLLSSGRKENIHTSSTLYALDLIVPAISLRGVPTGCVFVGSGLVWVLLRSSVCVCVCISAKVSDSVRYIDPRGA